jgi:hypothetical protein
MEPSVPAVLTRSFDTFAITRCIGFAEAAGRICREEMEKGFVEQYI